MRRKRKQDTVYKLRGFTDTFGEGVELTLTPKMTLEGGRIAYIFGPFPYAATWYQMIVADPGVSEWTHDFPDGSDAFVAEGGTLTLYQDFTP